MRGSSTGSFDIVGRTASLKTSWCSPLSTCAMTGAKGMNRQATNRIRSRSVIISCAYWFLLHYSRTNSLRAASSHWQLTVSRPT